MPIAAGAGRALFFAVVGQFLFVDHTPEYPRQARRILFWTSVEPTKDRRVWLYGFPYNRSWADIGEYVTTHESNGYFATNEDKDIAGFYVPYAFDIDRRDITSTFTNRRAFETSSPTTRSAIG